MDSIHIIIHAMLYLIMIRLKRILHDFSIYYEESRDEEEDYKKSWNTMGPYVYTLVMNHKKTFKYLFCGGKVDPISMGNMLITLHILRCYLILSNKMILIILETTFFRVSFDFFFLLILLIRRHYLK